MARTIALVSMPGGGKSTVGRQLARALGRRFVDADAEIERRIGSTIREYFAREGEQAFRDVEQSVIADVLEQAPGVVLATGGGAVLRESNRTALRRAALVFYLRTTPEELFRRLRHDTQRPLLQVEDPLAKLRELFTQRDPLYREVAHYRIETPRPSVPALLRMILAQLELAGEVAPDAVRRPPPPPRPARRGR